MGTYVYGLSGDFKNASLNGQKVRVCAYRFLYKESFDGPSQRLRKKAQRAEERLDRLNPAYAATVHEQEWDGVIVYEGPKLGTWADVRPLPARGGADWLPGENPQTMGNQAHRVGEQHRPAHSLQHASHHEEASGSLKRAGEGHHPQEDGGAY